MIRYLMVLVLVPFFAACATTVGAESPMDKELALLRQQNAELRRMVVMHRGAAPHGQPGMVPSPPSARPHRAGPPQEWAWLHQRPAGCENGPLAVEFENKTDFYVALFLDGKRVRIRGAAGEMPHIPPHASAYGCLQETGTHQISGIAYSSRFGELREVDRFDRSNHFRPQIMSARRSQWFPMDKYLFRFH